MIESDEAFARRLQQQEMGMLPMGDNTPLMMRQDHRPIGELHDLNAGGPAAANRGQDISNSHLTVMAILFVNLPQVLASVIVLSEHWSDPPICDVSHEMKWRFWSLVSFLRMGMYSAVVFLMYYYRVWFNDRPRIYQQTLSIRNMIDGFGLIWFIIGNMWVFGDDDLNQCIHPEKSPIYSLCVSLLVINYIQICLPCIIAAFMIPVLCFCMPCLIRVMARINNARVVQGAGDTAINSIPLVVIGSEASTSQLSFGDDNSCPICLNEMVAGEEVRLLRCKHVFHKGCVDEWLRMNASCPTCRKSILRESDEEAEGGSGVIAGATSSGTASATVGGSNASGGSGVANSSTGGSAILPLIRRREGGNHRPNSPLFSGDMVVTGHGTGSSGGAGVGSGVGSSSGSGSSQPPSSGIMGGGGERDSMGSNNPRYHHQYHPLAPQSGARRGTAYDFDGNSLR